jgi:hypothetical protein
MLRHEAQAPLSELERTQIRQHQTKPLYDELLAEIWTT